MVTLGRFLIQKLAEHGVREVFGIPGDFALPLFRCMEEEGSLRLVSFSHEPAVGFAADGAARCSGRPGVACVTYGAGALNMVNAVAGAYAEKSPLVVISGGPGRDEMARGVALHHQVKSFATQLRVYREVTQEALVLDDPATATGWDMIDPEPDVADYRSFTMRRIEALNHALRGLPKARIRYHLCWGSWHGPHVTDIAMRDIVEIMLRVDCQAYSFEAGNVRHEHEWRVWQEVKLPDDKILLPGVVSHATNVVEHPELVADRICRFADIVGKERVVASTDCGLGGRVHPQIAWAKLEALAQGATVATKRLWR